MGRRRLSNAEKSIPVQLPQGIVDLIDRHIHDELFRTGAINIDEPTGRQVAARRRRFLCDLIEKELSFEARHPVRVRVLAPVAALFGGQDGFDPSNEVKAAIEWMRAAEERLTGEAPAVIREALRLNELQRLRRDDPAEFRRAIGEIITRTET